MRGIQIVAAVTCVLLGCLLVMAVLLCFILAGLTEPMLGRDQSNMGMPPASVCA